MKKPKIPIIISVPRDKGWKNLTYPDRELTESEIVRAMEKKREKENKTT